MVEVVGAKPIEHASFEFGINNGILHNLYRALFAFDVIPITKTLFFFAKSHKDLNSSLLPELDIIIMASFLEIIPKSP